jgi:putative transposase
VRGQVRAFIEELLEEELAAALGRGRYERRATSNGRRHGHRPRQLVTTFGALALSVPRARLADEAGEREGQSALLPAYKRLSHRAEGLIAEAYLAGINTRRVRRALARLFEGRVGKDVVSRAWQRTRSAWEAWQRRELAGDAIVRLILDGTVVRVRLDRKATAISRALGERRWRRGPGWRSFLPGVGSLSILPIGTYAASANFHQPRDTTNADGPALYRAPSHDGRRG